MADKRANRRDERERRRLEAAQTRERERAALEKNLREDTILTAQAGGKGGKKRKKFKVLLRLKPYLIPQIPALVASCLLVLIVNTSELVKPYILSIVIARLAADRSVCRETLGRLAAGEGVSPAIREAAE